MAEPARKRGRPVGTTKPANERGVAMSVRLDPAYKELLDALCNERAESQREVLQAGLRMLQQRSSGRAAG